MELVEIIFDPNHHVEMASLNTTNPHSKRANGVRDNSSYSFPDLIPSSTVEQMWKSSSGDAVEDDSKRFLAVTLEGKEFVMADIRFVRVSDNPQQPRAILEFFFDGETDDVPTSCRKQNFMSALQERISWTVDEFYRRLIKSSVASGSSLTSFRSSKRLDDSIVPVGTNIEDAFRDAGCMLRFVAVRVSLTSECAYCIGCLVFPENFDVVDRDSMLGKHESLPAWIIAMGVSTVIMGVAMIYAWIQILVTGNSLNS